MWILKNSMELLEHLKSPTFNRVTSIKSFDFSHSLYNHTSPEIERQTQPVLSETPSFSKTVTVDTNIWY